MTSGQVYSSTTVPETKSKWFIVPTDILDKPRFFVKVLEVLLAFVAFILEEVVVSCISCVSLYFFEFVSCTAFLFTLLLLVLLSTKLHTRVGINCWPTMDFGYTMGIGCLFLISSFVFGAHNGGTQLESAAVAFGFLSSVAFLVDVCLFVRQKGSPCRRSSPPAHTNGDLPGNAPAPEAQHLNTPQDTGAD